MGAGQPHRHRPQVHAAPTAEGVPLIRRAGEPDEEPADLAQARRQFGMTTWEWALACYFDPRHPPEEPSTPQVGGPPLEALIARARPPVTTHFTQGALAERAERREHEARADHG
jgi:hypothetical protein